MKTPYTQFIGGLDLVSPPNVIHPGRSIVAINYETPDTGGYRSLKGYQLLGGGKPTGTGAVLGLAVWDDKVYAIRQNGATANLYREDGGSWTSVGTGLPVGQYDLEVGNFFSTTASESLFMVCDQGKPWKFDGTTLTELTNAPSGANSITAHANHLFLGFAAGSIQHSQPGEPGLWDATYGAGEIGCSDKVVGLISLVGGVLSVLCETTIQMIYGTGKHNWDRRFHSRSGVTPNTIQEFGGSAKFLGESGLSSLEAVQAYGDFAMGDWASHVAPLFRSKPVPTCSMALPKENQYRLFFQDGTGIIATFSGAQLVGVTSLLFPDKIELCATNRADIKVFADDTGQVFQLDAGTSFNGAAINTYLSTAHNHFGGQVIRKRFRHLFLDVISESPIQLRVLPSYDFGSERIPRHRVLFKETLAAGGVWDFATWDNFSWGTPLLDMSHLRLTGSGTHVGFVINSSSSVALPHTILGYTTHFDARRNVRG